MPNKLVNNGGGDEVTTKVQTEDASTTTTTTTATAAGGEEEKPAGWSVNFRPMRSAYAEASGEWNRRRRRAFSHRSMKLLNHRTAVFPFSLC
jgi:hypothetical protein